MFIEAIKNARQFTKAIYFGERYYQKTEIISGTGTAIILNDEGWILTCKHVAQAIHNSVMLEEMRSNFRNELSLAKNSAERKKIEKKYNIHNNPYETHVIFMDIADNIDRIDCFEHPSLDLALLHLVDCGKIHCTNFPIFYPDEIEIGKQLCKLGFPFPEFDVFEYSKNDDRITIKDNANYATPFFPLDGMVVRHIGNPTDGSIIGFEMSSPGLRGQSGGPIFDETGKVLGIQSATRFLDLGFDVNLKVHRGPKIKHIDESSILHLGVGIGSQEILKFLKDNHVNFASSGVNNSTDVKIKEVEFIS